MELFKYIYTTDPTVLDQGRMINHATSTMWIERYLEPGEFEIQAPLSTGLRDFLPLGTLISHENTMEVMIVENQEITETDKETPMIKITGRSFDSYLEHRIVGTDLARASLTVTSYDMTADYVSRQVVALINDHIVSTGNPNDALVNVVAQTAIAAGTSLARTIDRGNLQDRVRELLRVDDLGIKTIRRNTFGVVGSSTQTILSVYKGVDKSATVIFSWNAGDLSGIEYLFSNKNMKNSALVVGRYVNIVVDRGPTKYDRRFMLVDASDLDGSLGSAPTGATLTQVLNRMTTRGLQALAAQYTITISQADISNTTKYQYRKDYNVGDLISLEGDFGQMAVMRVTEYAEIEDENGESGHPTLSIPGE